MDKPIGRPRGSKDTKPRNTAARKLAAIAAAQGMTPLDVMLADMRAKLEAGDLPRAKLEAGDLPRTGLRAARRAPAAGQRHAHP